MELERLAAQNPWWFNPQSIEDDFQLKQLKNVPLTITHPLEKELDLKGPRLYILRGPRQIGKTTLLKKIIRGLLQREINPKNIFYFAFDIGGIKDEHEVADLVITYLDFAHKWGQSHLWLFLDEVTYTPHWSIGLKILYDQGHLENLTLVATGSSSLDLKRGGERLPGRRGIAPAQSDLVMLPLLFRYYVENVWQLKELPKISLEDTPASLFAKAQEISLYGEKLKRAWEEYIISGGYPLSIVNYRSKGLLIDDIYYTYLQSILGDISKAGKSEAYFRELIYALVEKQFTPVDWALLAQMTTIGSHNTVADYIETLEAFYVLKPLYQLKQLGGAQFSFRKRRKIYFIDPFIYATLSTWALGLGFSFSKIQESLTQSQTKGKIVENVLALHLWHFSPMLSFWQNKGEIDFICIKERRPFLYLESKYQGKITSDNKKWLKKVGQGVIISKDCLAFDKANHIAIIPAPYFCASV